MGVVDGQAVNQAISNAAFLNKNQPDTTTFPITLAATGSSTVSDVQGAVNKLYDATGASESDTGKVYSAPASTVVDGEDHETSIGKLANKFHPTTGHNHNGTAGGGAPIVANTVTGVPLHSFLDKTNGIGSVTGSSIDVSATLSGKTASTASTVAGVVVDAPFNRVILRSTATGSVGDRIVDADGNEIYGRLSATGSNFSLAFFKDIAGIETSHSFSSNQPLRFYYQELYNPLGSPPTYKWLDFMSENVTVDIIQATQSLYGKTVLANAAPTVISSTGGVGTPGTARVALADHSHSLTVASTGGSTLAWNGSTLELVSPSAGAATPTAVIDVPDPGVALDYAREDHVHEISFASIAGETSIVFSSPNWEINSPAASVVAPPDIAVTGDAGTYSGAFAVADHTHKGVRSVKAGTGSQLFGDVTITAGTNIVLSSTGNDVTISASGGSGGGGGGSLRWVEITPSPVADLFQDTEVYRFDASSSQQLRAVVKVPSSYVTGTQAKFRSNFAVDSVTGTVTTMQISARLARPGVDPVSGGSNVTTATGSLSFTSVGGLVAGLFNLTSATGGIGSAQLQADDVLQLTLNRTVDGTYTNDVIIPVYASEVTFS